jgi:hypothetical protein
MTELILDFWLRISPKNSVLESEMKQVGFRQEAARLEELVPVDESCAVPLGWQTLEA